MGFARGAGIGVAVLALCAGALGACLGPKGDSLAEKQRYVAEVHDETLAELYEVEPSARENVRKGAGYGVFRVVSTKIFLVSPGQGFGVVVDNASGSRTYMRMAELGGGVGLGIKDLRLVFVFHDRETLQTFVEEGWQFGGEADVAAKTGDTGAAAGVQTKVVEGGAAVSGTGQASDSGLDVSGGTGIDVYQLTEHGAALSATVRGTKYWKNDDLN